MNQNPFTMRMAIRCIYFVCGIVLVIISCAFSIRDAEFYDDDDIFLGVDAGEIERCTSGGGYTRVDESEQHIRTSMLDRPTPTYLRSFKNPCWIECMPADRTKVYPTSHYWNYVPHNDYKHPLEDLRDEVLVSRKRWRLRCLPHFYLIGWLKCGSTDLFSRLITHPDIITMHGKEIRYWTGDVIAENEIYSLERYLDVADIPSKLILENFRYNFTSRQFYHPYVFGDATPEIIFNGNEWIADVLDDLHHAADQGESDEHVTYMWTPKLISHLQPQAKFIAIIRNPITMTFSSYKFFSKSVSLLSVEHFHSCVVMSINAYVNCEKNRSENFCSYTLQKGMNITGGAGDCITVLKTIQYGRYYIYIRDWMEFFPREQFHIIQMERYSKHQKSMIESLWDFLDLASVEHTQSRHLTSASGHVNSAHTDIGEMMEKTRQLLQEFFAPYNRKLAELMHDSSYLSWNT